MLKKCKNLLVAIFIACFLTVAVACKDKENSDGSTEIETPVTYELSEESVVLGLGETKDLTVLNNDSNATVEWKSDDISIVTVSDGTITAKNFGSTRITAKIGKITLVCKVDVVVFYENIIELTIEGEIEENGAVYLNLLKGDTYTLSPALIDGEKVNDASFVCTTESQEIAVSNLTITAREIVENAKVTITCEYQEKTYTLSVYVTVSEEV